MIVRGILAFSLCLGLASALPKHYETLSINSSFNGISQNQSQSLFSKFFIEEEAEEVRLMDDFGQKVLQSLYQVQHDFSPTYFTSLSKNLSFFRVYKNIFWRGPPAIA